jgi:hypothetical protein
MHKNKEYLLDKMNKNCSVCEQNKSLDEFPKQSKICKLCKYAQKKKHNAEVKEFMKSNPDAEQTCTICNKSKKNSEFILATPNCKECHNAKRKEIYAKDETTRNKLKEYSKKAKENFDKTIKYDKNLTKTCKYCNNEKELANFRFYRDKCLDCERSGGREYRQTDVGKKKAKEWVENNRIKMKQLQRDWTQLKRNTDRIFKIKSNLKTRLSAIFNKKDIDKHVDFLGCNYKLYVDWIFYEESKFTAENHGKEWEIDHVIPLSHFDLEDDFELYLAFNWRNTLPLTCIENMQKKNNIIVEQIRQHVDRLDRFHKENAIEMPQEFVDLYAKHLVAGIPLEPTLPLLRGNEEEGTRVMTEPNGKNA